MHAPLSQSRKMAWMVWLIVSIFYAYQYVLRVMPNILLSEIMQQFQMDAATFGQFSGIYYIGYSLMHLPLGILLDRFGPKKILSLSILCTVLGMSPLIFTHYWLYPILGRFLLGLGSSAAILGVFKIVRLAFRKELFSRFLSFSVMIGLIGAIYGGGPVQSLHARFGYDFVLYVFTAAGLLLALGTYLILPTIQETPQKTVRSDILDVLKNPKVLWACISAGFMVGPLEGFADVWGTAFLKQSCHYNSSLAASLPSMIFIGMCFGSPLLNMIAEKTNYLVTIIGAGLVMAGLFISFLTSQTTPEWMGFYFIIIGICSAYQILAIYKASTYVPERISGLTTAMANMIIMIFGYAVHTSIGSVVHYMGGSEKAHALLYGIWVIPATLLIGSIGFSCLFVLEKRGRLQDSPVSSQ